MKAMSNGQLTLAFDRSVSFAPSDYVVTDANQAARQTVDARAVWPHFAQALVGPVGAGKTHLAHIWLGDGGGTHLPAARLGEVDIAAVLADVPRVALDMGELAAPPPALEEPLLHLYNAVGEADGRLLLVARELPARWPVSLPDLRSRLAVIPVVELPPPDDDLLVAVIAKQATDRQIHIDADVITMIVKRIDRTYVEAQRVVAALDAKAMATRRSINRGLAGDVLRELGYIPAPTNIDETTG